MNLGFVLVAPAKVIKSEEVPLARIITPSEIY
jgi:hypothetical protein